MSDDGNKDYDDDDATKPNRTPPILQNAWDEPDHATPLKLIPFRMLDDFYLHILLQILRVLVKPRRIDNPPKVQMVRPQVASDTLIIRVSHVEFMHHPTGGATPVQRFLPLVQALELLIGVTLENRLGAINRDCPGVTDGDSSSVNEQIWLVRRNCKLRNGGRGEYWSRYGGSSDGRWSRSVGQLRCAASRRKQTSPQRCVFFGSSVSWSRRRLGVSFDLEDIDDGLDEIHAHRRATDDGPARRAVLYHSIAREPIVKALCTERMTTWVETGSEIWSAVGARNCGKGHTQKVFVRVQSTLDTLMCFSKPRSSSKGVIAEFHCAKGVTAPA